MVKASMINRLRSPRDEGPSRRLGELEEQLRREGLVAVPQKPSTEMIIAGSRAGDISPGAVMAVYQAMLKEAELTE